MENEKNKRVLIIEDEKSYAMVEAMLIEEIGFKVMIMKKDYRESEPYTTDTTAIFLCVKP